MGIGLEVGVGVGKQKPNKNNAEQRDAGDGRRWEWRSGGLMNS